MDGPKEVKSAKDKYQDIIYMWNLKKKNYTNELIYITETDSQT